MNLASSCGAPGAVPISPADEFRRITEALCEAVARQGGRRGRMHLLVALVWTRLKRAIGRFSRLAAQVAAGEVPRARARDLCARSAAPRDDCAATPPAERAMSEGRLPRSFGWLCSLTPEAACHGSQLRHLMSKPEMQALVAASPAIARMLRPLCWTLAVSPDREMRAWLPGYGARPRRPAPVDAGGEARAAVDPSPRPTRLWGMLDGETPHGRTPRFRTGD